MKSIRNERVMVLADRNRPVMLTAVEVDGDTVVVVGVDPAKEIGYPIALVFRFDDGLFARLAAAHQVGDEAGLRRLWDQASRYS